MKTLIFITNRTEVLTGPNTAAAVPSQSINQSLNHNF